MTQQRAGRWLLALMLAVAGWAALVAITGGIDARASGLPLRSHDARRPALLAAVLGLAYAWRFGRHFAEDWAWIARAVDRATALLAVLVAGTTLAIGLRFGSFVAGGADAYGYVSQADLWLAGDLIVEQPIAREVPWPLADWTLAPLGYRPSVQGGGMVPTYAPGLPILMAASKWATGACGPYYVVPLLGAATVWLTFVLGRQLASPGIGLAAAVLMAASPVFLFMMLWPMSDVPVSTFWVGALAVMLSRVRLRPLWTGLLLSGGILVRPNLAPVAVIHHVLYGAPWKSGYGDLESLYSPGFFTTNISRYTGWLRDTQTPWIFLAAVPVVFALGRTGRRHNPVAWVGAFTLGIWVAYMFYAPFEDWWYLRFLLPVYPPMLVLALLGSRMALSWLPPALRGPALMLVFALVAVLLVATVRRRVILQLGPGERTYISAAAFVARTLPSNAIILAMQHSGSLRLYADRPTLRYDWLAPEWWPRVLDELTARGYRPYVVLDDWEIPQFQRRFAAQRGGAVLPGRVLAKLEPGKAVYVFDPLAPAGRADARPQRIAHIPDRCCDRAEMRRLATYTP
jgi:hypothetical protein